MKEKLQNTSGQGNSYAGADFGIIPDPDAADATELQLRNGVSALERELGLENPHPERVEALKRYVTSRSVSGPEDLSLPD